MKGENNLLYDLSVAKESNGVHTSLFADCQSLVLKEHPQNAMRQDASIEIWNMAEYGARASSMSFCENPMAEVDVDESNI